ncbi:hypothetical protein ACL1FK_13700, partial [Corynebacterium striatum]
VRPEPGSNSPQKNFSTKAKKSGREKPKPNKKTNQPKPTPSKKQQHRFLTRLANPKITIQRKITTTPNPTGQKKGGSQTTKMIHAIQQCIPNK